MPPSHLPEHKIAVFVRFCPPEPPFSGISSTKSRFLCAFAFRNPRFRAFRAQNLGFCARKVAKMLGKRWMGHWEEVDGASGITKMTFVKLIAHSNTHCYLRRPEPSPVPGAGRTTKKDDQYLLVVLFCLACVLSVLLGRLPFAAYWRDDSALFLLCDIPALRTNIRKVPRWSVYAIEYLARRKYQ